MSPNLKRYIALFSLSVGSAASYTLVYIKYVFYDAWVMGLGLPEGANESAGFLLTMYTIGNIILYIPGGYIADRFSPKKIIAISLIGTGILDLWYAFDPSYETGKIIWFLFSFTTAFAYWAASIKAVRMLGTPQEQGRMYGFFNAGEGVFSATCLGLATVAFGVTALPLIGLKYASFVMSGYCFVAAILTLAFFDEKLAMANTEDAEEDKFQLRDVGKVLLNPWVWCVSVVVVCCYASYTGQSYLTPYMTQVIKVSAVAGALLGILRTKGARFTGGPLGGIIADHIGSSCKVIIGSNIGMIALLSLFFIIPGATDNAVIAITLSLLVAFVNFMGYNIMFAAVEEAHIPRYLTGTAVGIISIMGYSPDGFINTLFGGWLDKYGDAAPEAYRMIFLFLIGTCVVGSVFCWLIMRRHQRIMREEAAAAA